MDSKNEEYLEWMCAKKRSRRQRKIEQEWPPSDVRMLIQLVEQRVHLWDPSRVSHKDGRLRESSFGAIAGMLNRTTGDCKAKWENLRAQYRSAQAKAVHNFPVKWQYFEHLNFLQKVCESRRSKSNVIQQDLSAASDDKSNNPLSPSQLHFIEDLDTCSSSFSLATKGEAYKLPELNDLNVVGKLKPASDHTYNSAQIFGDFVADQIRQLKPDVADQLKRNILKLVVDALDKNI